MSWFLSRTNYVKRLISELILISECCLLLVSHSVEIIQLYFGVVCCLCTFQCHTFYRYGYNCCCSIPNWYLMDLNFRIWFFSYRMSSLSLFCAPFRSKLSCLFYVIHVFHRTAYRIKKLFQIKTNLSKENSEHYDYMQKTQTNISLPYTKFHRQKLFRSRRILRSENYNNITIKI